MPSLEPLHAIDITAVIPEKNILLDTSLNELRILVESLLDIAVQMAEDKPKPVQERELSVVAVESVHILSCAALRYGHCRI